jgi:hypothetical protein
LSEQASKSGERQIEIREVGRKLGGGREGGDIIK